MSSKPKLAIGIYRLRCVKCAKKHAKASGDAYFSVECQLIDHPGYKVWETIMLAGKGVTLGKLKLVGWGFAAGYEPDAPDFLDKEVSAHLGYEEWQGEDWLKVKAFATKTGGYVVPAELLGDAPPQEAQHKNPDRPAGRPRTKPSPDEDPDLTPF
jgi:hypothetical protein